MADMVVPPHHSERGKVDLSRYIDFSLINAAVERVGRQ